MKCSELKAYLETCPEDLEVAIYTWHGGIAEGVDYGSTEFYFEPHVYGGTLVEVPTAKSVPAIVLFGREY